MFVICILTSNPNFWLIGLMHIKMLMTSPAFLIRTDFTGSWQAWLVVSALRQSLVPETSGVMSLRGSFHAGRPWQAHVPTVGGRYQELWLRRQK